MTASERVLHHLRITQVMEGLEYLRDRMPYSERISMVMQQAITILSEEEEFYGDMIKSDDNLIQRARR